jgi:hypothetical protein
MNPDKHQSLDNWEASLGRALKNLPERQAPAALMTNVMARVRARAAERWYQRSWWQWPVWLRAAAAVLLLALLVLLPLLGGHFWETSASPLLSRWIGAAQTVLGALASVLDAVFRTKLGFGQEALRWVFVSASLLLLAMYLTCIGVGTVVYRTVRKQIL